MAPVLSSGNAILWDLSPPAVSMMRAARRRFSYQRRAFTTRLGVVRISRLGNSDSTACRSGAQVHLLKESGMTQKTALLSPLGCQSGNSGAPPKSGAVDSRPEAKSHPPRRMAFCFPVLVTGLPANHGRWFYPPRLSQAILAGLPLAGPLRWRMLLPGVCRVCGLAGFLQQPVHHWHTLYSNRRAVPSPPYFQGLVPSVFERVSRIQ